MPRDLKEVGDYRITLGTFEDGEGFRISDYWRSSRMPDRHLQKKWKGTTEFRKNPDNGESEAPNSATRWLTPRSPGNSSSEWESGPMTTIGDRGEDEVDELACESSISPNPEDQALRPFESRMRSAES